MDEEGGAHQSHAELVGEATADKRAARAELRSMGSSSVARRSIMMASGRGRCV